MSSLAPLLQGFFTDRLIRQRRASPHTVTSYRDTFRLLLAFASARCSRPWPPASTTPLVFPSFLGEVTKPRRGWGQVWLARRDSR